MSTPDITSALSIQSLFSAISDLSGVPIEVVAQDRTDLELAHAQLGRLIERIPEWKPVNQLVALEAAE